MTHNEEGIKEVKKKKGLEELLIVHPTLFISGPTFCLPLSPSFLYFF